MSDNQDVLKSKTKKIYKSNKLNTANFANYNLNDYRVYLNTIALVGGVNAQGKYLQQEELAREYTLSANEFSKEFNVDIKNSYRILKAAVDKLMKTDITVEKPELREVWRINVCEMAKYNEHNGTITVLFTGSIIEYLKQRTKNFTLYNLKEVADLTSLYAVRLYELIQQFNTTTGYLINTIEQWKNIFGISHKNYLAYNNFKQKVLVQAMEEINNKTSYRITMLEEKEGRKVVRVKFNFKPDEIVTGMDTRTGELSTRHKKKLMVTPILPEELAKKEARKAKQKEYQKRFQAKKIEKQPKIEQQEPITFEKHVQKNSIETPILTLKKENITTLMESLALLKQGIHPDQEKLEKMLIAIEKKNTLPESEKEQIPLKPRKKLFGIF